METMPDSKPRPRVAPTKWLHGLDAERIVQLFEDSCGDLSVFLRMFGASEEKQQQSLFKIELMLSEESNTVFRQRWDRAADAYQRSRMARLQRKAYDILEDEKQAQKNTQYVKFILNDIVQAKAATAKRRAQMSPDGPTEAEVQLLALLERLSAGGKSG